LLYFIPAWYHGNDWKEFEQVWYLPKEHSEFDETVKQVQLFNRRQIMPFNILLLSFAPNFRHFLHRQSVFHAPYWSCFDAMCGITSRSVAVFSMNDILWPEDVEFIHSPFCVLVRRKGALFAQVEFGEDGNMIRVDQYRDGRISRRSLFDDRGFISCCIFYEDGLPKTEEYYNEQKVWKLRRNLTDGHVEVNPKDCFYVMKQGREERRVRYKKMSYRSLEEVISEVLGSFLLETEPSDIFCAASDRLHNALLYSLLGKRKLILTFFAGRLMPETLKEAEQSAAEALLSSAAYIVADSPDSVRRIQEAAGKKYDHITDITPYDTRVDFGISTQLSVQEILVPADRIRDELFGELVPVLAEYMQKNKDARVHLFTRLADYNRRERLLEAVRRILQDAGYDPDIAREVREGMQDNGLQKEEPDAPVLFFVDQCVDEMAVSRCLKEVRIIVDPSEEPDLFLQISAVSMGIPQIGRTENQYLVHGENGMIVRRPSELPEVLAYYLENLSSWNSAMIASYEIGKKYTTDQLVTKWRGVLEAIG